MAIWPTIPLLGIYPEKTLIQKDTCTPIFIAALFTTARTWKQPKCPSSGEYRRYVHIYTKEYYSVIKNKTGSVVMWMNLESATPACSDCPRTTHQTTRESAYAIAHRNYSRQPTLSLLTLTHPVLPLRTHNAASIPDLYHCLCILIHLGTFPWEPCVSFLLGTGNNKLWQSFPNLLASSYPE